MKTICIARDFGEYPMGRLRDDGLYSGQAFREDVLEPAIAAGGRVLIDLSGTRGYSPAFLDEAFGGLRGKFTKEDLRSRVEIIHKTNPSIVSEAWMYINKGHSAYFVVDEEAMNHLGAMYVSFFIVIALFFGGGLIANFF